MKHNYLFLHKDEFERLKSQGAPPHRNTKPETDEYIASMNEQSRKWIKHWPDTVKGQIFRLEKEKERQHAKDIARIKRFKKEQRIAEKTDLIEKAKQMIFEGSCYGRQLYSALLESKTLEERDVQIEFKKKISKESKKLEEMQNSIERALQITIDMKNKEIQIEMCKRDNNKEVAEINKAIYLNQNEVKRRDKEKQRQDEVEDMCLLRNLLEKEKIQDANNKYIWKQDLELCVADRKKMEQRREMREKEEEHRANVWRKYQDTINYKTKMMHKRRFEIQRTKNYELLSKLKNEEQLRYDEFINKGIIAAANRLEQEELNSRITKKDRNKPYLVLQTNDPQTVMKEIPKNNQNKDVCDRQCIISKCKNICKTEAPSVKQQQPQQGVPELMPKCIELVKTVGLREKECTPWNGLTAAHAQFARHASETLKECQYKNMARKVVDEYRRLNCLNEDSLPVSSYY